MTSASSKLLATYLGRSRVRATSYVLRNGLEVVVLPYPNRPIVNHAIWYRVGSADDPPGKTGMAHLLEHLMDKATSAETGLGRKLELSKTVELLGSKENAFTEYDATCYHQRIAPEHLETVMNLEADRMVNLELTDEQVRTERDIVLEERLGAIDREAYELLYEQVNAMLFLSHPYTAQVDGWAHDIASITRSDLLDFYRRYYTPRNAILVVAGNVQPEKVLKLARKTYGKITSRHEPVPRQRPLEPPHCAAREVTMRDVNAPGNMLLRKYYVPSYATAGPRVAEALNLLSYILADSDISRLYTRLAIKKELAAEVEGRYSRHNLTAGRFIIDIVAEDDVALQEIVPELDKVIREVRRNGVTEEELERAKIAFISSFIYRSDSATRLARRIGRRITCGETLEAVEAWPERIVAVTVDDVLLAARNYLDPRRSVTGYLLAEDEENIAIA